MYRSTTTGNVFTFIDRKGTRRSVFIGPAVTLADGAEHFRSEIVRLSSGLQSLRDDGSRGGRRQRRELHDILSTQRLRLQQVSQAMQELAVDG